MRDSDFDVLLSRVVKPARYTDGEWNAVHKEPRSVRARAALIYPDVYEVGMSHLGLQILYHVLNSHPDFAAERAFAPWPDMEAELRSRGLPLTSLESRTPLREFDLIGITLPYELTYANVLNVLDLGGVPIRAAERGEEDPIVVGGGPGAVSPEPMAEFFDAILVGEGEEAIIEIAEAVTAPSRAEALEKLAQVAGVYVPSRYEAVFDGPGPRGALVARDGAPERIERRIVDDLEAAPFPTRQIVPFLDTVHSRVTLEIMRGCARGCRFCQAGATYRPRRMWSVETLLRQAEEAVATTGYDEISLLAFTSVDHTEIGELTARLVERFGPRGIGIALPSLRADAFSVELANTIQQVRKTGLTFAPEAASDRLRRVIRKQLTEDDLFAAAEAAFASGWTRLKLYFMIGLPTETDDEVAAIGELVHRLTTYARSALGGKQGRLQIGVSVTAFVPKPHTPFQWMPQEPTDGLVRKLGVLQRTLRGRHVKLSWSDPATSALEAAIARGDRRVGRVIEGAWRAGARFDSWGEHFEPSRWQQEFERQDLRPEDYANAALGFDERLAWDHVSCGVGKEALRAEAVAALDEGKS